MGWLNNIWYFFPFRLLIIHFRKNLLLISIWALLFLVITNNLGNSYGVPYLFLDPEYLGVVGYFSFQLLGICFGVFFITWNITSYILLSYRYPFMASLKWPVAMFTLNNIIIPLVFVIVYTYNIIHFQKVEMLKEPIQILWSVLGFFAGITLVILVTSIYFVLTNTSISKIIENKKFDFNKGGEWNDLSGSGKAEKTEYYLTRKLAIRPVRDVDHYDDNLLRKVFQQHHVNAFFLLVFTALTLIGLGFLIDWPIFEIPAAGSVFLFFGLLISLVGLIYYWAEEWGTLAFLAFFASVNYVSQFDFFNYNNQAYGINYNGSKAVYNLDNLGEIASVENMMKDKNETEQILDTWLQNQKLGMPKYFKPKMLIVMSSGGGSRSALFTMKVLQTADSLTNHKLMKNTVLMTGASGGVLGIGYFRELYLRNQLGVNPDLYSERYLKNIAKDILNKVCASIVTNDLYYPFQSREIFGYEYVLDRGMMMEQAFNSNTEGILDKPISDYMPFEKTAAIPMLFVGATNVADSRKIIISPQPISYMMKAHSPKNPRAIYEVDAIDFGSFFKDNNPYNLRFISALRMNATYPLIMPNVSLPSTPQMDVMDAGLRDNYGIEMAVRFLIVFKDWINANTSGVVIVQIRDMDKHREIEDFEYKTFLSRFMSPIGNLYSNVTVTQDYLHDYMLDGLNEVLKDKLEIVRFQYLPSEKEKRASMSFRLTEREIESVIETAINEYNMQSYERLLEILED
jgi:hypothetical protein